MPVNTVLGGKLWVYQLRNKHLRMPDTCLVFSLQTSHAQNCNWPCLGLSSWRTKQQSKKAEQHPKAVFCGPHSYSSLAFHVVTLEQATREWQDVLSREPLPHHLAKAPWPSLVKKGHHSLGEQPLSKVLLWSWSRFSISSGSCFFIFKRRDEILKALPSLISRDYTI